MTDYSNEIAGNSGDGDAGDKSLLENLPQPFGFYRYILGGDHLHFGLWPDDEPGLTMEEAQERMFERLLSFLPPAPAKILDVGCGLGYSAHLLSEKGYAVTAIAPAAGLIAYARRTYESKNVRFIETGFFGDHPVLVEGLFDVLFFQESMQYLFPLSAVMERGRKLLSEKGVLVMGDEVCYSSGIRHLTAVHTAEDFTVALSENGFKIAERVRIGGQVSPTCRFIVEAFTSNFDALVAGGGKEAEDQLLHYLEGWKNQQMWYEDGRMGYELIAAKKDPFFIRPYTDGDEKTVLPMFNQIFHVNRSIGHWHWKFRDNPYGSYRIALAFSDSVPVAAHYAGYPVPFFSYEDSPSDFLSFQIGDTMTSPEVRNIGLGKTGLLARTSEYFYAKFCEGRVPFIYGFNTGHIRKLGMRYLGYVYISPVTYWTRDLTKSPLQHPPLLQRLLAGFTVEEVTTVDAGWDDFFSRVGPSYRLLVRRGSEYLKWRYLDCPDKVHRVFSIKKRGVLTGWSVFTLRENKLLWGDALFDRQLPESVSYLLHTVVQRFFPDANTVEGWFSRHPDWWSGLLETTGFKVVPEPNELTPCFVIFGGKVNRDKLEDTLYYTWGDSDLF
ncbi:MAG: methyltransferase domain-containing protein [Nitrospirae bacterium]|nr:methyltransferase domain-containing protein [Nitrospirota bacterium]